ncbi:MAG TPA: AAA domain-containing protein, partial [Verrucomicrobiae bacterium]|nr:AAA domain-containing protein [Verrucomicrobiae bacterium]
DAKELVENLARIHSSFKELSETLEKLLAEHHRFDFPELTRTLNDLRAQAGVLPELLPVLCDLAELPEQFARALRHAPLRVDEFEGAIGRRSLNQVYRLDRLLSRFEGRTLEQRMARLERHHKDWLAQNSRCIRAAIRRKFVENVSVSSLPAAQLTTEKKIFKKSYSSGRRDLEHEFGKTMRYKSIRDLAAGPTGHVIKDLKPIWLMSPLSVSDTLPLDPDLFDVVIFDEASQIPVEEAIPALYRSHQAIVVGDEMQLPPTTFFSAGRGEDETVIVEDQGERIEVDLDADSFLTQSGTNLPSTLLAWHYRSRYESLISFSNAAYYSGNLFTIPDRQRALAGRPDLKIADPEQGDQNAEALLERSISFHFMEQAIYMERTNPGEAAYIAHLIRGLLKKETKLSIGVVAFSEAQQTEIEESLTRLGKDDADFENRLEAEFAREENDQFCGLFVKNLENVQGDERDIIILSICYGHDADGRMLMNFGPINQRGGEKRLNVIFSRARHHMAVVTSIRHLDITNDFNDGANSLKNFLQYAEAVSKGDETTARRVLENLNPLTRKSLAPQTRRDAVVEALARGLQSRGYAVELNVGQSKFRCDLAVRPVSEGLYQLGILVDTDAHYANPNLLDRYLMQPAILRAFGWRFALVLTKDWYHDSDDVLNHLERILKGLVTPETDDFEKEETVAASADPASTGIVSQPSGKSSPTVPTSAEVKLSPATQSHSTPHHSAPTSPSADAVHHFEYVGGGSQKFWEINQAGNSVTVRFGRIGTGGQTQTKTFADESRAGREIATLISEKLKKGYSEKRQRE